MTETSTETSHVITEDHGDHLVVINNNPRRRNALTDSFQQGFHEALALAGHEPRIGAVVVTGAEGFFCAGGDLSKLQRGPDLPFDARRQIIEDLQDLIRAMIACPRPVIAAVEGGAAGAGASIALACDPQLLIADEPTTALDVTVQAGILDLLRSLAQSRGMALILVSHDLAVVAQTVSTGLVMHAGRIVEAGPVTDLIGSPKQAYTRRLVASARALDRALTTGEIR